jgi:outer membrane murein-binding lipoprotein Lpp
MSDRKTGDGVRRNRLIAIYAAIAVVVVAAGIVLVLLLAGGNDTTDGSKRDQLSTVSTAPSTQTRTSP